VWRVIAYAIDAVSIRSNLWNNLLTRELKDEISELNYESMYKER